MPQQILLPDDKRTMADEWSGWEAALPPYLGAMHRDNGDATSWIGDFRTPWWPAPSALLGDGGLYDALDAIWYADPYTVSGCCSRLAFIGITRDQYGSPLAGCTVRCFLTSTTEMVSIGTSDANGAYTLTSPYAGAHFLTVHPPGGTTGGATIDTLVPS